MIAEQVTVSGTAQLIAHGGATNDPRSVLVKVPTGGATVYAGGSDVNATVGYPIEAGATLAVDLVGPDDLYLIVASDTQVVNVLRGS